MVEEGNANVALEEEAASTSAESLTATEGASAEKGDETKAAETQEKSSQQTSSADESEEKDPPKGKDVPYGQYSRIKESRDKYRTKLSALEELGIKSPEDAEFLLKDAETAKEEAHLKGRTELTDWILEDPSRFLGDLQTKHPKVADQLDRANAPNILERIAVGYEKTDAEFAEKLLKIAADFRGTGRSNGTRAPEDSANDAINREKLSVQDERQQTFDEQVQAELSPNFRSKVTELSKGRAFSSDKQRERFFSNIFSGASEALDKNPIFTRQYERLRSIRGLSREQVAVRRKEVVDLHIKHATDPSLLKRLIDEEAGILGITIKQAAPNKEVRGEVNGSGAPANGKLTQSEEDRIVGELTQKFTGSRLSREIAHALSRAKSGA